MIDDLNKIVGQRLSEILKGEKQVVTAGKLNVEQGTVSKWKNGETIPNPDTLVEIADLYDVSVDWLLGLSDVKEKNQLSSEKITYAHVLTVLDRLFKLANIEVLDFYEAAKDKNLAVAFRNSNQEAYSGDTDYIKINDRVLSYLLRRRKQIYSFDEDYAQNWIEKCIAIFRENLTLDYRENIDSVVETNPLSTFKEGDWGRMVAEINNMSEEEIEKIVNNKTQEKDGKEDGRE